MNKIIGTFREKQFPTLFTLTQTRRLSYILRCKIHIHVLGIFVWCQTHWLSEDSTSLQHTWTISRFFLADPKKGSQNMSKLPTILVSFPNYTRLITVWQTTSVGTKMHFCLFSALFRARGGIWSLTWPLTAVWWSDNSRWSASSWRPCIHTRSHPTSGACYRPSPAWDGPETGNNNLSSGISWRQPLLKHLLITKEIGSVEYLYKT